MLPQDLQVGPLGSCQQRLILPQINPVSLTRVLLTNRPQREGFAGLYKGLVPNVLRVMPQSALTFLVYESVMHYLSERSGSTAGTAGVAGRGDKS